MTDLAGKVALVTGADGAIGRSICEQLQSAGAQVAGICHPAPIRAQENGAIHWFDVELSDFAACHALIERIEAELGPLDIVINCSSESERAMFIDMTREQWQKAMRTSLDRTFNLTRQIVDGMTERGFGRIVNIASISGRRGSRGGTHAAACASGIHGFTMALAQEVASKGVTVNTVSPGYIDTEDLLGLPADRRDQIIAHIPAQRFGHPREVAMLVQFLVSDSAGYITGEDIALCGGQQLT
jgi:acetoacetyl-CoA reductase